jgi:hypothetical protein
MRAPAASPAAGPPRSESAAGSGWLGIGLLVLAAALAVNSLLGPLATGVVDYHVSETLRNQTIGLDAASLLLAVPLAALAGALVLRGHAAGPVLALAPAAYTAYMMPQYVLGPEYLSRPGNNELAFPLHLGLFVAGWGLAVLAWRALDGVELPGSRRRDRRVGGVVLPLLALVTFVRYVPAVAAAAADPPTDPGYLAGPTFFWVIALLDLGVLLPLVVATCAGLLRGARCARAAMYLVTGWLGLVGVAVAAMAIAMAVNDDPVSSAGSTVLMVALGAAFALLAALLARPLLHRGDHVRG